MEQLSAKAKTEISAAEDLRALEDLRIKYLGKKGLVTAEMSRIGSLGAEEKKTFGAKVNSVRDEITNLLDAKKDKLEEAEINKRLASEKVDITLPVRPQNMGKIHPISKVMEEISHILGGLGFEFHDGPDIEDDYHNFTALNIPENHPARQMHDTFYLPPAHDGSLRVLRTHTSNVQIRAMENIIKSGGQPPFRIFSMGRTYRSDSDMTHTPMFHQVEALYIDKDINFGHLKWAVHEFVTQFFSSEINMRFRPSFFPFTEPSAEVDIDWGNNKWLEIMGCGMVHPNVLKNVGIDPEVYSGFAFGAGIERMAMLKYNIPDLRQFFESDLRWLKHYGFAT
jgi:phenylalanyl-tRNA synthetase alpha chain